MAEHYDVLSITQETAVVSPTATLAVSRVSFVTKPYGWQAWVNIPVKGATVDSVKTSVEQYALLMNLTAEYEGTVGGYGAQDVDDSGLLTDYLVVVVGYETGRPDLRPIHHRTVVPDGVVRQHVRVRVGAGEAEHRSGLPPPEGNRGSLMPLALPPLLALAALIVALGLIMSGQAFVDSLTFIIKNTVGKIPLIGRVAASPAVVLLQSLSHNMGTYADDIGGEIAASWHYLATIVDRTGWAIYHASEAIAKLAYYVEVQWPLDQLWKRAQDAYDLARRAGHAAAGAAGTTVIVKRFITTPSKTPLAPAVRALTRPLRLEVSALDKWTHARFAALSAAVAGIAAHGGDPPRGIRRHRRDARTNPRSTEQARTRRSQTRRARRSHLRARTARHRLGEVLERQVRGQADMPRRLGPPRQPTRRAPAHLRHRVAARPRPWNAGDHRGSLRRRPPVHPRGESARRRAVPAHVPFGIELPPGA